VRVSTGDSKVNSDRPGDFIDGDGYNSDPASPQAENGKSNDMTVDMDQHRQTLMGRVKSLLKERLDTTAADTAVRYLEQYFRRVPSEDLLAGAPADLAAIVIGQLEFLQQRKAGDVLIRVFNPVRDKHGWESSHTIIEIVNDDKPFLVDTGSLTLAEMGLNVHLIVHPVIRLARDGSGRLTAIHDKKARRGQPESVLQFQVDRRTAAKELKGIRQRLHRAYQDVQVAVADWKDMEQRVREAVDALPGWAPKTDAHWLSECRTFLEWLMDDHFIFLGVRDYDLVRSKSGDMLKIVAGSGLGILRETDETVTSRPLTSLPRVPRRKVKERLPLIITKTNARSTVHRAGYLDYIGVLRFDGRGRTVGERRILGLFTSRAYTLTAMQTPLVRVRAQHVMEKSGLVEGSHAWKTMVHTLETLPRDELYQANSGEVQEIAFSVLNLQERAQVRLLIRRERYGRFYSCLVYLPRERFNTENREQIQGILFRALKGKRLDYAVHVAESRLARLQVIVRPRPDAVIDIDVRALEQKIIEAVRSWTDELRSILVEKRGEETGLKLAARFAKAFPEAYKEDVSPWVAAFDVENAAAVDQGESLRMSLYRPRKPRGGIIRFKVFRKHRPIPLSDALPMLENLGLHIVNERPYELVLSDEERLWIQDFDMSPAVDQELDLDIVRELFQEAFEKMSRGVSENDGFNRLVIAAQLNWWQVTVLRAYCKYLLQTGVPFSLAYMAETLAAHPGVARLLVELFEAHFDPGRDEESDYRKELASRQLARRFEVLLNEKQAGDPVLTEYIGEVVRARMKDRGHQARALKRAFERALESVASLDEDRILSAFYQVIQATLRTSFFQQGEDGAPRDYISFKLDSQALPDLPLPRPYCEIWVYSARVEGIHLRGGKIARGGLRWSDRREDFRTEVLGLMKAQNVKNTMIVPVGAKGGFVVKHMPEAGGRDAMMSEVVDCYSIFINGLLDITDNLIENKISPPKAVVRQDEDDPYLVVAADKGTATFSDTANAIAAEHNFWLGDAFASGGSVGYDHKGMGITAKGAWESVKRHFREMGIDIQREPFTVVGIGDMSGDVFGNGMLLSRKIRLRAAFNHQHIFLDPDPDERISYRERRRLFRKRRSSWTDYNPDLISKGGGVYSRLDKTIPLSPEVRQWLATERDRMTPSALIRALLQAEADLLWNGGIGTYVKSSGESNAEVGDLANNALRVDGRELGCRVVGEGGNLGVTQSGRIEFARSGGRINTDFIDNSAGVDTSDHEVNIKILLNQALRSGRLEPNDRVKLLADMADEVERLVLRSNYLQTQAISMMVRFSGSRLGAKQHFIGVLENRGLLDRDLEFLPSDEELSERRDRGEGMVRPELAVLLSYSKITLYQQLLESDVPEDDYLSGELVRYFPEPLQKRFADLMPQHRLKREIITTQVTNSLVNRMGASFSLRMCEDTGSTPAEVARAYSIAREVFQARTFWAAVEALDNKVKSELQISALLGMWKLLRQATRWLLNLGGQELDVRVMVERLRPGLRVAEKSVRSSLSPDEVAVLESQMEPFLNGGFAPALAERIVMLERLSPALDIVETAVRRGAGVARVAKVFLGVGEELSLKWLRGQLESLKVMGQWHAMSRADLRDQLFSAHNGLVEVVLQNTGRRRDPVGAWLSDNEKAVIPVKEMLHQMMNHVEMDYATISVAVRALEKLVSETADGG
jgi:glutamate dehydrogenase